MTSKEIARIIALIISSIYVGLGTIQLMSIFNSDGMVFSDFGVSFNNFITPAYIIGFGFGFGGGTLFAMIGQLIVFGILYIILYGLFLLTFKESKILNSEKKVLPPTKIKSETRKPLK